MKKECLGRAEEALLGGEYFHLAEGHLVNYFLCRLF
jgi:hypothetical protein